MRVLAIDTSSRTRVVCALAADDGALLEQATAQGPRVGASLPGLLRGLLGARPGAVVVVTGPGSYTGIRAGMAAALGIAVARDLPLHGVGTLEVVAAAWDGAGDPPATAVADAGRGALYAASVGGGVPPAVGPPRRVELAGFSAPWPVLSLEPLPVGGLVVLDPAVALARAVPLALGRQPLARDRIEAVYVA